MHVFGIILKGYIVLLKLTATNALVNLHRSFATKFGLKFTTYYWLPVLLRQILCMKCDQMK